ncbi:MAG: FecR domain-containing protein [Saprospiraceae bacterium]|nr:FecR domain-containing protein [Saprospiraceae bacterium]MCB0624421.1 FecR domain-containing protein [Saprospiraceae bacterium]MCB0677391.1 FecR domain-containing protein [Saprospiraceae bacterium]
MKDDGVYVELIAKYLSGNLGPEEKEALFAWVKASDANRTFFEEMVQVWGMTEQLEPSLPAVDLDDEWAQIQQRLQVGPVKMPSTSGKTVRLSIRFALARVAAVLLLALAALWWYYRPVIGGEWTTIETALHEEREVTLPDGSRVWLNERTRLSYRTNFDQRHIQLSGEAFFKVERDESRPFVIYGGDTRTEVLGTSFNLRAYPEEKMVELTVKTGLVAFSEQKGFVKESVELPAGNSGLFDQGSGELTVASQEISNADAWHTGRLEFHDQSLAEVKDALERYFGTEILVENPAILECPYTGQFQQPELDQVLSVLSYLFDLQVEKMEEGVLLRGIGCVGQELE